MCGIFGMVGSSSNAALQVFYGLKDIEYRGYDSWGIAYPDENGIATFKQVGFLPATPSFLTNLTTPTAIGHTRWATHGGVTNQNAHPHHDCDRQLALVHNGIVENYLELKKELKKHTFLSETDSEVIIHSIEDEYKKTGDLFSASAKIFNKLKGLNAFVVTDGKQIIACKKGSPLVVGKTSNSYLLASDPNALLPHTKELIFLEDDQIALVTPSRCNIYHAKNQKEINVKFTKVDWDYASASLQDFKHFMLKEISEQPKVLLNLLQNSSGIEKIAQKIKKAYGTYLVGCGTAAYSCLAGLYLFSTIAKRHVNFSLGSEFNYTEDFIKEKSLLIAVSQSGETIDVIEPVQKAKTRGADIIAITNVLGSTLYRLADQPFLLQSGVEKAVASTKALTSMFGTMILLAYASVNKSDEGQKILKKSAKEIQRIIVHKNKIKKLASKIYKTRNIYILGRGPSYPVAMESALKIKEISYIHAEGFAAGELKHGVIALIEKGTPVIAYVPNDETKNATISNAIEVKARGAYVIGVGSQKHPAFDYFFEVKDVGASSIIPHVVFAQLLAYYLSTKLGFNPDKPRNLAKSVVVR